VTRTCWILAIMAAALPAGAQPRPRSCIELTTHPVMVALDAGVVSYCFEGTAKRSCYTTDLGTGAVFETAAPTTPGKLPTTPPPVPPPPQVQVGETDVRICHPDGTACKTFTPRGEIDPGLGITAAANDAGTLAAISAGPLVETYNLTTGKRIAQFKPGPKLRCFTLAFAGDALVIGECGDAATARLVSKTGKPIAPIGGARPIRPSGDTVHLGGTRWAFSARAGDTVVIQDVATGKVVRRFEVGPASETASAVLVGNATWLALVFGGTRASDVALIDLATGKVTSYPGKRCS
jgi:hypothetical protein